MNDEISYLNYLHSIDVGPKKETKLPREEKILKHVLINILLGHYWTDLNHIQTILSSEILKNTSGLEEIIEEITILD